MMVRDGPSNCFARTPGCGPASVIVRIMSKSVEENQITERAEFEASYTNQYNMRGP
jgi:hypothetical protein